MTKAITLHIYAAQVSRLMASLGRPQSQEPPRTRHIGDAFTVTIPVHWSVATLNFIVTWDAAGIFKEPGFARRSRRRGRM